MKLENDLEKDEEKRMDICKIWNLFYKDKNQGLFGHVFWILF